MDSQANDYHISFFKPSTKIARLNRNIVIFLVCIWTLAIFGFQILLKVVSRPTPEPAYTQFEKVWEPVRQGTASTGELQAFVHSTLSVLGKNFIDAEYKQALDNALSFSLAQLAGPEQIPGLKEKISAFEELKASTLNITDPSYVRADRELEALVAPILGIPPTDIRSTLISPELSVSLMDEFSPESREAVSQAMALYLIHPQSFLTDAKFLGFPFHYFYTSIFLLMLFVGLCWLYCIRTDRRDAILGIKE